MMSVHEIVRVVAALAGHRTVAHGLARAVRHARVDHHHAREVDDAQHHQKQDGQDQGELDQTLALAVFPKCFAHLFHL
jgi:hypothetical protein